MQIRPTINMNKIILMSVDRKFTNFINWMLLVVIPVIKKQNQY